jgi:hypothetical protein
MLARCEARMSSQDAVPPKGDLVSWCSEARTRRGDELARQRMGALTDG